jgi:hypothetical protein
MHHTSPTEPPSPNDFFRKNGFVVFPNVYSQEAIRQAREMFDDAFKREIWRNNPHDSRGIINNIYGHYPALPELLFNRLYFEAIRQLAGCKVVWLPECAVHHDRYAAWHKDTTEQELGGVKSHLNRDNAMLQVATYFQSNDAEEGGGITVVPGSHLQADRFLSLYHTGWSSRLWRKILKLAGRSVFQQIERRKEYYDVPSNAGDLVIFDVRTDHRATLPKRPPARVKYAVFNTFGNPSPQLRDYLEFMKRRPEPYYRFLSTYRAPAVVLNTAKKYDVEVWE